MSAAPLFDSLAARPAGTPVLHGSAGSWDAPALLREIEDFAARLTGGRVLAVLADNGPAWVIADLATLHSGMVHLPLPAFFNGAQLAHALQASGADLLLTDQPARVATLGLGFAPAGEWQGLVLLRRDVAPAALPRGTAKLSFTSGSTGAPKGVCLSAAGLLATATALTDRLGDLGIARHLAVLPLALLLENVAGVYAPLLLGAEVRLSPLQALGWTGMAGFDPAALQRAATMSKPGSVILVPELLKAWTQYLAVTGTRAPTALRYAAVGGARVDAGLLARARALGLPAYQGYGLTECGSAVSLNRPGDDGDGVGRPLGHAVVRVVEGELRIATPAFLGYLGGSAEAGEFATGDLGDIDAQGHLHLSGRRKNLLVTSFGRNIAPEWVESVLLAQPEIMQVVVAGESRPWLHGVLVPLPGAGREDLARAVTRANAVLPDYARIGGWIAAAPFSPQNGLATGNGRPLRTAILNFHAAALVALYHREEPTDVVL